METIFQILRILLVLGILTLIIYIPLRLLKLSFPVIKEGQVAVIERQGKFARVAGPGQIHVIQSLEEIDHYLTVRTQGAVYEFPELWIQDFVPISVNLTLSYHRSFEGIPYDLQKKLAYYPMDEWNNLTRAQIERTLQDVLPTVEFSHFLSANPVYRADVERMTEKTLGDRLRPYGMILDNEHGLALNSISLPEKLRATLIQVSSTKIDVNTRGRLISELMTLYPGHSEAFFLALAGFLAGQDVPTHTMLPPMIISGPNQVMPESPHQPPPQLTAPPKGEREAEDDEEVWQILKPLPKESEFKNF